MLLPVEHCVLCRPLQVYRLRKLDGESDALRLRGLFCMATTILRHQECTEAHIEHIAELLRTGATVWLWLSLMPSSTTCRRFNSNSSFENQENQGNETLLDKSLSSLESSRYQIVKTILRFWGKKLAVVEARAGVSSLTSISMAVLLILEGAHKQTARQQSSSQARRGYYCFADQFLCAVLKFC